MRRTASVVSKGPQHAEFDLADNMWGAEFLPQPAMLPLADVEITHGGNNTTTECFHFGKPMIVLPLFWDQHDNAQRSTDGFGVRLRTYEFGEGELLGAIDRLSGDESGARPAGDDLGQGAGDSRTMRAADLIERLAHDVRR